MSEDILKECRICKSFQTLENFKDMSKNKYNKSPYCIPCEKEKRKQYYLKNSKTIKRKVQEWRINNREKHRIQNKKYRENNLQKERLRLKTKEAYRRSKIAKNGEFLILEKEIKKIYSSCCSFCGSTKNICADHIIPISRGGKQSVGNLQPLCRRCNTSKGAKFMSEWKKYLNNV